jgi:cell division cycle 20, cofactor of APC complex
MQGDRFIPNRGAMNMNIAETLLFMPGKQENLEEVSPSRIAYKKLLADTFLQGRTRIFSFCDQHHTSVQSLPEPPCQTQVQPAKKHRHIPEVLYIYIIQINLYCCLKV